MEMKFIIKVDRLSEVLGFVDELKNVCELSEGLKSSGQYLVDFFGTDVFESEGAVYGSRWSELSPGYEQWKTQHYPGRGILERTSTLRKSFGFMSTDTYLKVFNPVVYFRKHQLGEGVPQRMMMKLDKQRIDEIIMIMTDTFIKKISSLT